MREGLKGASEILCSCAGAAERNVTSEPMDEARQLYTEQAGLSERVRVREGEETPDPLVIWDVGLGAAANAMAAITCFEAAAQNGPVRPLRILSFENDLDSLALAFRHSDKFTYLRHSGPAWILREGSWQSREHPGLSWQLVKGDFLQTMQEAPEPPDVIFYDMFSSKTCLDQWTLEAFVKLFTACQGKTAELFTYTCSTASRVAMLAAGFTVARGRNSGVKQETTIAFTSAAAGRGGEGAYEVLGAEWLKKWHRSGARYPVGLPVEAQEDFERLITGHPQFANL